MKVQRDWRNFTVDVAADGEGLVSHAGAALLGRHQSGWSQVLDRLRVGGRTGVLKVGRLELTGRCSLA